MGEVRKKQQDRRVRRPGFSLARIAGIAWAVPLVLIPGFASADPQPRLAPQAPAFQQLQKGGTRTPTQAQAVPGATGPKSTGYLPSPVDRSHLKGKGSQIQSAPTALTRAYAPLQYDLRSLGRVTAVRDQGSCGACWTFGTIASGESILLPGETRDFSENNLKNTSGFQWPTCSGGNADMAAAYFARWSGPVAESDDPYDAAGSVSPSGLLPQKHIQEVLIIPDRASSLDNDAIKQALIDDGAVTTSIYVDGGATSSSHSSYYNPSNHSYYYNGGTGTNHIVAIVGWDDTYSATNFSTQPPGNGAFIVKNSWGTWWGDSGYFYVSYYDTVIGKENYLFKSALDPSAYSKVYQYDPLGATSEMGYTSGGSPILTGWFANIFTAVASEDLGAVAFHTNDINVSYQVFIYTGGSAGAPRSGVLAIQISGTIPYPGYHTVTLPTPVALTSGQLFSVVVAATNPSHAYPIPLERPIGGYASATASPGQSFVSSAGSSWSDVTGSYADTNVTVKAFTLTPPPADGVCGSSNGGTFTQAPDSNLCNPGSASQVTLGSGWHWSCAGTSSTATCSAFLGLPLSLSFAGTGSGSVSGALSCTSGSACTSQIFAEGTPVTLLASPGGLSTFTGWSGDCATGSTTCAFTMDAAKSVTATFTLAPMAKIGSSGYGTLAAAYTAAAPTDTILALDTVLPDAGFTLELGKAISLKGGYRNDYGGKSGVPTVVTGPLLVRTGELVAEDLKVR